MEGTYAKTPENIPFSNATGRRPFNAQEIKAVVLRYEGLTYDEIGKELGISPNTIKLWFKRGQPLYGEYWYYAREMSYQAGRDAVMSLRKQIGSAVNTVKSIMEDKNIPASVRLQAAKFIIEKIDPIIDFEREGRRNLAITFARKDELGIQNWAQLDHCIEQQEEPFLCDYGE